MPVVTSVIAPAVSAGFVTVTFTAITNGADSSALTITAKGAQIGMFADIRFRAVLEAGIIMKQPPIVTAADTITFYLYNTTGAPVTPASQTVDYWVI